jgi:hypothetical protein
MQKIKIVRRGFNSRRYFRKLNSVTELVGKEVEVADNQDTVQAEIEEVSVTNDEVTLTLDNGDDVVLDSNEVENLLETGEAISEDDSTSEGPVMDEYSVTREVLDADGNINEVTTVVESADEDSAVETVTLLDSRRGRNSRNYVVRKSNSRKRNSSLIPTFTIVIEGEGEYEITDAYVDGNYVGSESFGDITVDPTLAKQIELGNVAELHWNSLSDYEEGVAPNVTYLNCDTKRNSIYRVSRKVNGCVRKASVMACNSEEAIEAVKESDGDATVESEYSVEEGESTESPVIISDEEVAEVPAEGEGTETENPTEGEGTEGSEPESDEKLEEPASQSESTEVKVDETPGGSTEVTVSDEPAEASIEEADRESNSFKGVAEFVNRKYGVKL